MELSIKPVEDRIFVLQDPGQDMLAGIHIPEGERKKVCKGVVVAAGPGWTNRTTGVFTPMTAKVGDKVGYQEYASVVVEFEGVEYQCVKELDLLYIE